jgi:16S rRNA G966 N2-methylase RsmD
MNKEELKYIRAIVGITMPENKLYYGDNLDIMRRYIKDEAVDLVYLDPPFNSNATYNVLFTEKSGAQAAAQIKAFEDTWKWDQEAARAFQEVVEGGGAVSQAITNPKVPQFPRAWPQSSLPFR